MIPARLAARQARVVPQFHRNAGATLLSCDADSLIYVVAATTNNIETAKRRFVDRALTLHFLADAAVTHLHLTPKHCRKAGRFNVKAVKPYQGNRDTGLDENGEPLPSKKPLLVEPLRYAVGRHMLNLPPEFNVVFNDVYEADDSVVMECTADPSAIFYSEDKDLLCLYNRKLDSATSLVLPAVPYSSLGTLELVELSHSKKVVGRGRLFFWAQMLMGDTADNIKGILKMNGKLCGATKTYDELKYYIDAPIDAENLLAEQVLGHYRAINQNPWPEAWLLWLYPKEGYNFHAHLKSLGLLDDGSSLSKWLNEQLKLPWFIKESK